MAAFLTKQSPMILDGGLATEMEARGCDLRGELWSASYLTTNPGAIDEVHRAYLAAGADCIVSASYQATLPGFCRRGLSLDHARALLRSSVEVALRARDGFWARSAAGSAAGRQRPLVAASVGPYGAYLANGSEYTGDYDLGEDGLLRFHAERFELLARTDADLLACETLPSAAEARALVRLLRRSPNTWAWLSFSCRDGRHLCDGSALVDVARELDGERQVAALGINCTAPSYVAELIGQIRQVSAKPVVVYPNSGEIYQPGTGCWIGDPDELDFADNAAEWVRLGASLVGGCCRTGPEHVRQIRRRLAIPSPSNPSLVDFVAG